MKTWDSIIKKAMEMHTHKEEYAYWYGAKGAILTNAYMDWLVTAYPNHFKRYSALELEQLKAVSLGKIGLDCSGFITEISGCQGNSAIQIGSCTDVSDDLVGGVAGSLLWKPSHVGIDVGYGFFLHCPTEGKSIEMGRIREYDWQKTGHLPNINYDGSDSR